jgi:hypothetical protein
VLLTASARRSHGDVDRDGAGTAVGGHGSADGGFLIAGKSPSEIGLALAADYLVSSEIW